MSSKRVSQRDRFKRMFDTPQKKTFSVAGLTLLVVAVFLVGAIRPTISTMSVLLSEYDERKDLLTRLETKYKTLQNLSVDYEKRTAQKEFEVLEEFFPSDGNFSLYVANLEEVSQKYSVTISSIGFSETEMEEEELKRLGLQNTENLLPIMVNLELEGHYQNAVQFIEELESMPTVASVRGINYQARAGTNKNSGQELKDNIRLQLILYESNDGNKKATTEK